MDTATQRIYLSPPHLAGREEEYVAAALRSGWIAPAGPALDQFERQMCDVVGLPFAVGLNSATSAIHLALRHLNVSPGDEVLCSTLTFCASANPILYQGADPVFIDSDERTWNMDPQLLADELAACDARRKLPKAIIAVDLFGQSADMEALSEIAARYDVRIIEDSAEALGSTYQGRHVGSHAWACMFSFNGNKILSASGAGVLCSADAEFIENARFLASQARDPAPHYQHSQVGFNYRLSNLLAAVGLAQLEALPLRVRQRRENYQRYHARLADMPGISFMPEAAYGKTNRWLTVIQIDADQFGATREDVRQELERRQIESRPVWKPLHLQPVFAGCRTRGGAVAERLFRDGLCLPSGSNLTEAELNRVVCAVEAAKTSRSNSQAA